VKPKASIIPSPIAGPTPMPMYSASVKKLTASPRRSSGARSTTATVAAVKNSASPTPVSSRNSVRTATEEASA
jgi:hypothetical protein